MNRSGPAVDDRTGAACDTSVAGAPRPPGWVVAGDADAGGRNSSPAAAGRGPWGGSGDVGRLAAGPSAGAGIGVVLVYVATVGGSLGYLFYRYRSVE